jgi:HK97 gp10 family phage protein
MGDSLELLGAKQLKNLLGELPKRTAKRGLRQAVNAGANPILKAAKAAAPEESGLLEKSLKKKIKSYPETVVAIIGSDRSVVGEFGGKKRVPANYIALVEQGHGGPHPAPAHPFLGPAYEAEAGAAKEITGDKLLAFVEKEASKLA